MLSQQIDEDGLILQKIAQCAGTAFEAMNREIIGRRSVFLVDEVIRRFSGPNGRCLFTICKPNGQYEI